MLVPYASSGGQADTDVRIPFVLLRHPEGSSIPWDGFVASASCKVPLRALN
jgi:hypothetical protein